MVWFGRLDLEWLWRRQSLGLCGRGRKECAVVGVKKSREWWRSAAAAAAAASSAKRETYAHEAAEAAVAQRA